MSISVESSAFAGGQAIPRKYSGEGDDVSPPLAWAGVPAGTRELVLICDDPDAPGDDPWVHWVLARIPGGTAGLPEAAPAGKRGVAPAGMIDGPEAPEAAAERELAEETGFAGSPARLLGSVHPNPAIQDNRCHAVLVEGVTRSAPLAWDPDEEIEISTAPVDEVLAWARAGRITHSLSLNALMLFEPRWAELRQER